MKSKILCLGNEFIKDDSLAKKISNGLKKELPQNKFKFIDIDDSFQLLSHLTNSNNEKLQEKIIILDVVQSIKDVKLLEIKDLNAGSITNAHDFDAGFFLQLLNPKNVKIIGVPMNGNLELIKESVKDILTNKF